MRFDEAWRILRTDAGKRIGERPRDGHGRIGERVTFEPEEYEASGRLKVNEVRALSSAAIAGIEVGEFILAVDGKAVTARSNFDELMDHKTAGG